MIKTEIIDGGGDGESVKVKDNALLVTQYTCPPLLPQRNIIFRQYFTDDGTSSGSEDMQIEAGDAPKQYWIPATDYADRYITQVSFVIGDGAASTRSLIRLVRL